MLAHELRNPLAPIRAAAEVLRRSNVEDERVRRASDVVARQCDHLTSLVDDLLDVSRVTRGVVELQMKPVAIRRVIDAAVEQSGPALEERGHHLAVENVRDALVVLADGIGIEPEMTDRVFALFAQAERSSDRSSGGLGLGLALVKSLIELHGGTVVCRSEGLGKGSTFTLRLPLMHRASEVQPTEIAAEVDARGRKRLRIVVVDDNRDAAQTLSMLLELQGYEVWAEFSARDALERAATQTADVYLLDIGLPGIDGLELARRLKSLAQPEQPVLVAVTGYGQPKDREETRAAGFSHHLVKPVDPSKLLALLEEI
jgi:CheY-like chemotaxis protein